MRMNLLVSRKMIEDRIAKIEHLIELAKERGITQTKTLVISRIPPILKNAREQMDAFEDLFSDPEDLEVEFEDIFTDLGEELREMEGVL